MTHRARILLALLVSCGCLIGAAIAWASETFTISTHFTPYELGAATNLSAKTVFSSGGSVPTPVTNVLAYGPAGLTVNVNGAGTCAKALLEKDGASGCPVDSRIGFGGGVGLVEIAKELIKEPFTLDFFLAPKEDGHLAFYIYVNAVSPVSIELVLTAKEVQGAKPYGLGVTIEIPPIATLPGAAYASAESAYFTFGSQHVAYFHTVNGKRQLVHVKGLILPKRCPTTGFPFKVTANFIDATHSTDTYAIPCPHS
jgi:hypothetical protein